MGPFTHQNQFVDSLDLCPKNDRPSLASWSRFDSRAAEDDRTLQSKTTAYTVRNLTQCTFRLCST